MPSRSVDGIKVISLRLKKGMSQTDLSELSGVSRVQIQRIEGGKGGNSSIATVSRLASALDATMEEITNEMEN